MKNTQYHSTLIIPMSLLGFWICHVPETGRIYDDSKNVIKRDLKHLQSASCPGKATSNTEDWVITTAPTCCWNREQTDLLLLFLPFSLAWGCPEETCWPVCCFLSGHSLKIQDMIFHGHILEKEEKVRRNTHTIHHLQLHFLCRRNVPIITHNSFVQLLLLWRAQRMHS